MQCERESIGPPLGLAVFFNATTRGCNNRRRAPPNEACRLSRQSLLRVGTRGVETHTLGGKGCREVAVAYSNDSTVLKSESMLCITSNATKDLVLAKRTNERNNGRNRSQPLADGITDCGFDHYNMMLERFRSGWNGNHRVFFYSVSDDCDQAYYTLHSSTSTLAGMTGRGNKRASWNEDDKAFPSERTCATRLIHSGIF